MDETNEIIPKINLFTLGDSKVGKTCFILRFTNNIFQGNYLATIGIDVMAKKITLSSGEKVNIGFYDTAGEERYRSISLNLIKTADAIVLMYSINNKESFENIPGWIESVREVKGNDFPIILIGNKCDLEEEREIKKEEGEKIAEKYGFHFYETSNKDGTNVDEVVIDLVTKVIENKKKNKKEKEENKNINLEQKISVEKDKKKKGCC